MSIYIEMSPKPPKQAPSGRVYPPPTPSRTVRPAPLQTFSGTLVASLKSKIRGKNVYFLLMGPLGADNDTIKPATTHIIPAIRRLYAQSGPKVTPKWSQSAPKVTFICQKLSQSDPKATPT